MSNKEKSLISPFPYKREEKILSLDLRIFKICQIKEVPVWNPLMFRHDKWLVHLNKHGKWNIQKIPP
jgi:hypothetical protein